MLWFLFREYRTQLKTESYIRSFIVNKNLIFVIKLFQ